VKLKRMALCLALAASSVAQSAQGQKEKEPTLERVAVTGSSIKRTTQGGGLPITIINRSDIDAAGISSAEQLMLQLNVASNSNDGLDSNVGIVSGDERGNNGASSANLRQQGAGATLVLLNGRRIANHGLKGASVDLNSIPFAAIERVEVLRAGASAVYGTDAVGGVINFISRKDYQGFQIDSFTDVTEAGGGDINRVGFLAGLGDIVSDGFNIMGSLSYKKVDVLRGNERDFTNTFQPLRGLSPDTRGGPFASINNRVNGSDPVSPNYNLIGAGLIDPQNSDAQGNPYRNTVINVLALPGQPGCESIEGMGVDTGVLWNRENETNSCAWDYPRAAVLQQPVDSIDFLSRATFEVSADAEFFVEVVGSRVVSRKIFEPNQITPFAMGPEGYYPREGSSYDYIVDALSDYYGAEQLNLGAPIAYRWRCMECGNREIETTNESYKVQLGTEGVLGEWDYSAGLAYSFNEAESELGGGYHYTDLLAEAIGSGKVDPFLLAGATQTQAGVDAINAASARGVVLYGGETTLVQMDASISGDTGYEAGFGGETVMLAAGIDLRREGYRFSGDRRALADRSPIYGAPFDDGNALDDVHRDIKALFAEALVPLFDNMDVNLAARYDHYSGFGGTTNVGLGVQYQPAEVFLFRGAYSTGFRAPSFNQLFNGVSERPYTGSDLADPASCPNGIVNINDPDCQPVTPLLVFGGKEDLGPEESKQSSVGLVWTPVSELSVNLDWWEIITEGSSQAPTLDELLENSGSYVGNFIRDSQGNLTAIDVRYVNAGERHTSGVEVGVQATGSLAAGVWGINLNGSYLIEDRKKLLDGGPFGDNLVGSHSRGNIPLRWKHSLAFDYAQGNWRYSLQQIYRDGYEDEVPAGVQSGAIAIDAIENYSAKVASYLIYNVNVAYSGFADVDVAFGVKNLFDRDPPFTAHQNDYSPGAAFDPRIASARGRAYTLHAEYRF